MGIFRAEGMEGPVGGAEAGHIGLDGVVGMAEPVVEVDPPPGQHVLIGIVQLGEVVEALAPVGVIDEVSSPT